MKRFTVVLLVALLLSFLPACGSSAAAPTAATVPTPSEAPSPPTEKNSGTAVKTFGISAADLANAMSKAFKGSEYGNAFENEPEVEESEDKTFGKLVSYSYPICDGAQCVLYETKDGGEAYSVFLVGDSSKMDTDDAKAFGAYAAIIIDGFESDDQKLTEIDSKLDIANTGFSTSAVNVASGTSANFTYLVDDGTAMLLIDPA